MPKAWWIRGTQIVAAVDHRPAQRLRHGINNAPGAALDAVHPTPDRGGVVHVFCVAADAAGYGAFVDRGRDFGSRGEQRGAECAESDGDVTAIGGLQPLA